ncbi:MAG: NUDIX domain-containing protein [Prolixibacteraceae bacterium]|nr:NUDIX domain-containing protein [Prolixibacteraceae bacterium]
MIEVTCAILIDKNRLLVTQRKADAEHPLRWEFPGGKVHRGESAENCIHREIAEELEIEIDILERLKPVEFDYGFKKIMLIPFLCSAKYFPIKLNEHVQYKWVEFSDVECLDLLEADKKLISQTENQKSLKKHLRKQVDKTG